MINFKKYLRNVLNEDYTVSWTHDNDPATTKQIQVSDVLFSRAYRYLNVGNTAEDDAIKTIVDIGLGKETAKHVVSMAMGYDNPDIFFNAIKNRMSEKTFFSGANAIDTVLTQYPGINREFLQELFSFAATSQPVTGRGEVFIILFVNGATKGATEKPKEVAEKGVDSRTGGDVVVGKSHYEIKGKGARLRGATSGFGNVEAAVNVFTKSFIKLAKRANVQYDPNNIYVSINTKSSGIVNDYAPAFISSGKITREQIVQYYVDGFSVIYSKAGSTLRKWINESINQHGMIIEGGTDTPGSFRYNYFKFALQYYANLDGFTNLVLIDTSNKYLGRISVVSSDDIKNWSSTVLTKVINDSYPSITTNSGAWGAFFAIKIPGTPSVTPDTVPAAHLNK